MSNRGPRCPIGVLGVSIGVLGVSIGVLGVSIALQHPWAPMAPRAPLCTHLGTPLATMLVIAVHCSRAPLYTRHSVNIAVLGHLPVQLGLHLAVQHSGNRPFSRIYQFTHTFVEFDLFQDLSVYTHFCRNVP